MNYDMIDRFLRNNLGDDDYAEYSAALDALCTPQPKEPEQEPVGYQQLFDAIAAATNTPYEGAVGISVSSFEKAIGSKIYTTPQPAQKPLTHEQRLDLLIKFKKHELKWDAPSTLIDMVEAAHGIKE